MTCKNKSHADENVAQKQLNSNYIINAEQIKFELIKLALKNIITSAHCTILLHKLNLWRM